MLRIAGKRVSHGAVGPDVLQVHRALAQLGRTVAANERASSTYGPSTAEAVRALQDEFGVQATGVVDESTVRIVNAKLGGRSADERVVRGTVRLATGAPAPRTLTVRVWHRDREQERLLGEQPVEHDGLYEVRFTPGPDVRQRARIDLRVEIVQPPATVPLATTPGADTILEDADLLEVIDFVIVQPEIQPSSEYDQVAGDLKDILGETGRLDRMKGEHLHLLAAEASYPVDQLAAVAAARRLGQETRLPEPMFYALVRRGLPVTLPGLLAADPALLRGTLEQAIADKQVRAETAEGRPLLEAIKDLPRAALPLASLPPRDGVSSVRDLARLVLTDAEADDLLGKYAAAAGDLEAFWSGIAGHPKARAFRLAVDLGSLTHNHLPLVEAIRSRQVADASALASLSLPQWDEMLAQAGTPPDTPGATDQEKASTYRRAVLERVERAFERPFLAARLREAGAAAPVVQFLETQPDFDPRRTHLEGYLKGRPSVTLGEAEAGELKAYQRVLKLTSGAAEAIAIKPHAQSAQQIAAIGPEGLLRRVPSLGAARAREIHQRASQTQAAAVAMWTEHAAATNRTAMAALPRLDSDALRAAAVGDEQQPGPIPDWETLFGTFDLCECADCNSAHGAAAYLVDLLQFFDSRDVLAPLLSRRPDLEAIELSCENTNTVLPYVDLVNEILEDRVAPPDPFAPGALPGVSDADFGGALATEALRAAFTPPLHPGALLEVLDEGQSWRVIDRQWAYRVDREGAGFTAVARSRQTTGSTEERRAYPQYRNDAAYAVLKQTFRPWTLPFDRDASEAATFLRHLGVPRRRLIEALFAPLDATQAAGPVRVLLATEGLGLTDEERRAIVGEAAVDRADFWGGAAIKHVQHLLDGSGLLFAELDRVVATWFVNPDRSLRIQPSDSCDTTVMTVDGLNDAALSRLHRFVRLWRKLGWTIEELDRVLRVFAPVPGTPGITDEVLVRIAHLADLRDLLKWPILELLAFWAPIDSTGADSTYQRLFRDEKFAASVRESFRLRLDGAELHDPSQLLTTQAAVLQAVLRVSSPHLVQLIAQTDGRLTLANLSLLLRRARLLQSLRLTPDDLVAAEALTSLDPFAAPETTVRFVRVATAVRGAGFAWAELDYLLRHRFEPPAIFVPSDESLGAALTELRAGLLALDPAASDADRRRLIDDRLTATLSVPEELLDVLLAPADVTTLIGIASVTAADPLTRAAAAPQFDLLQKLFKVARVIDRLKLPGVQWRRLVGADGWLDLRNLGLAPTASPALAFPAWFMLVQAVHLRRELRVEDGPFEAALEALHVVSIAAAGPDRQAAKSALAGVLAQWLGWNASDVATLIGAGTSPDASGLFDVHPPDGYRGPDLLLRLGRAVRVLKTIGADAAQAAGWCGAVVSPVVALEIRGAAMARHHEDAWRRIAKPLQDASRNAQRTALVSYLVARPERWQPAGPPGRPDAGDLFAHLLIDVEMDACQLTSRIKQAIGSVQLFGQRCLLGLEAADVDDERWLQWRWMKNFRVWEANRKIWLYPENWIEPDLRDNKTPFFKELETELLQGEITDARAEQAVRRYLERLDLVGRLEICGTYQDDDTQTLHVFGRTFNTPRQYFYRRARVVDGTPVRFSGWTPWEAVDLDIEGDHLIPVVRNGTLTLLWPLFNEKQESKPVTLPEPGGTVQTAASYWEIQLAWSEYQAGRWSAKSVSAPVALRAYRGRDNVLFGKSLRPVRDSGHVLYRRNDNDGPPLPHEPDDVDPPPPPPPPPGGSGTSAPAGPLVLVEKHLCAFKAFAAGDSVIVRGYLSLGYSSLGDEEVAAAFGEFQLSGCRDIVTARPRATIQTRTLPLAPKGTRFNSVWFDGASGLRLLDGNLPVHMDPVAGVAAHGNVSGPLFDGLPTVASMKGSRIDIEVLRRTPTPYRLLAPHQDVQFKGDRPFFFMDHDRTLIVTSTGSSGQRELPDLTQWTVGDIGGVWTADYFGTRGAVQPAAPDLRPHSLVVLERGAAGRRTTRRISLPDLAPHLVPIRAIPQFWTTRRYYFTPFQHPFTCALLSELDRRQLRGVLSLETQERVRPFFESYDPVPARVQDTDAPVDEIDFRFDSAHEIYNWELFFHIPLLIADRLTKNQRFEEAMRWYHFIFDPTGASGGDAPQRYWRTLPFNRRARSGTGTDSYEAQAVLNIEKALAQGLPGDWLSAVDHWRANPFNPHAVARLRTTAYQKAVVMKYIDNLIAWGDQLFRRETLESLNEATQLYVLAAEVLGRRPEVVKRRRGRRLETYQSLRDGARLGPLSNAEQLVPDAGPGTGPDVQPETPEPPSPVSLYFCVPENSKLLGYWDVVADRQFKLRHCMDIEGRVRQLPLFEPPIDPALLVRAQAAGLSLADVLDAAAAPPSNHRFAVLLQKANELTGETRALASALLSVLERRDAEALALLRTRQEGTLLTAIRDNRQKQVNEAKELAAALVQTRRSADARRQFYESREFQNVHEAAALDLASKGQDLSGKSAVFRYLAGKLAAFGALKLGSPTTSGLEIGPDFAAKALEADAGALDALAAGKQSESQRASRLGEFERRRDDWQLQASLAGIELAQIDRQLAAAEIRVALAERELQNHDLQIEQNREVEEIMRGRFTSIELFDWMAGRISALYFQTYQLAFDLARQAERCLEIELGERDGGLSFIRFGHWDSLRKGLVAADQLSHDLKRLELAQLSKQVREYELTKHVSLATLDPLAFIALKETGRCESLSVPEALFDLDTPGHYLRRLKAVSVTIPCVAGPYVGVHCKVTLLGSEIRRDGTAPSDADGYPRDPTGDPRFIVDRRTVDAMVTSTAQNDAGVFEANLRDERYLPFEGAGAVSTWSLELPSELRTFDYNSISDVVLHLRYTARDGGEALRAIAIEATSGLIARGLLRDGENAGESRPLARLVSLRHEFPSEWHRFVMAAGQGPRSVTIDIAATRFPYFVQRRQLSIVRATVSARMSTGDAPAIGVAPGPTAPLPTTTPSPGWEGQATPGPWTVIVGGTAGIEDLFVVLEYAAD